MATADELRCMATITSNLQGILDQCSRHAIARSVEQEAIELLDLIPQVINTDVHPGRSSSLLFQVDPAPLPTIVAFMQAHLALSLKLRAFAIRTFVQVFNSCMSPDCADYMSPQLRDSVLSLDLIPQVMHSIKEGVVSADAVAAAELLFVLTMQLSTLRDAVAVQNDGVVVLMRKLAETDNSEMRSFLSATLRVLADNYSDAFLERDLHFFDLVSTVLNEEKNRQTVVLLLEILNEVLSYFPSSYLTHVIPNPDTHERLVLTVVALLEANNEEVVTAALNVIAKTMLIEGSASLRSGEDDEDDDPNATTSVRKTFNSSAAWHKAIAAAAREPRQSRYLTLMRHLVLTAALHEHTQALERGFMESFPSLCVLLNPEKSNKECMLESALIVAAMAAKSPSVRGKISQMVKGYEQWAASLKGTISHCLGKGGTQQFRSMFIVDTHQCILNDGAQLMNLEAFDLERISHAVFVEQERRSHAASPLTPLRVDLPTLQHNQSKQTSELSAKLFVAILIEASALALGGKSLAQKHHVPMRESSPASQAQAGHVPVDDFGTPLREVRKPGPESLLRSTSPASRAGRPGVSTPRRQGGAPPQSAARSRSATLKFLGETPQTKTPFRPSSPSASVRTPMGRAGQSPGSTQRRASQKQPLLNTVSVTPGNNDEYVSMAIMMHLPITYGIHYNRSQKAAVRRIEGPGGPWIHPVHRNQTHSWSAMDVQEGDLYVLFVPFHKITLERIMDEGEAVRRHLIAVKKDMVLTPQQKRSRRWFLHDMLNYILPKTELLLRDFAQLLSQFGTEDVVYQMGIIRLLDEGSREQEDVLSRAIESSDSAMPQELLRFSGGRLKDILHSGNIAYAVRRLREHYFAQSEAQGDADDDGFGSDANPGASAGVPSQLVEIDREIEKLERRAAADQWGDEAQAEMDDDIESAYDHHESAAGHTTASTAAADNSLHREAIPPEANPLVDPSRYTGGGSDDAPGNVFFDRPTISSVPKNDSAAAAANSLPPHLREQLAPTATSVQGLPARPAATMSIEPPTIADFEEMYSTVEAGLGSQ